MIGELISPVKPTQKNLPHFTKKIARKSYKKSSITYKVLNRTYYELWSKKTSNFFMILANDKPKRHTNPFNLNDF
jgi:hypothetical protein